MSIKRQPKPILTQVQPEGVTTIDDMQRALQLMALMQNGQFHPGAVQAKKALVPRPAGLSAYAELKKEAASLGLMVTNREGKALKAGDLKSAIEAHKRAAAKVVQTQPTQPIQVPDPETP
jgi:hypothetical protein